MAHDSRAVANEILKIAQKMGIQDMSIMKLIKLVYFAHELTLGFTGRPLCDDSPEAWQYGPVFRQLYFSVPHAGAEPITKPIKNDSGIISEDFSADEMKMINAVMDCYGKKTAFQLSSITHQIDTPWYKTKEDYGVYWPISDDLIKGYCRERLDALEKGRHS